MIQDKLGNELHIGDLVLYASGKRYYDLDVNIGIIKKFYSEHAWANENAEPDSAHIFIHRGKKLITTGSGIASRKLERILKCPDEIAKKYDFIICQFNEFLTNIQYENK